MGTVLLHPSSVNFQPLNCLHFLIGTGGLSEKITQRSRFVLISIFHFEIVDFSANGKQLGLGTYLKLTWKSPIRRSAWSLAVLLSLE